MAKISIRHDFDLLEERELIEDLYRHQEYKDLLDEIYNDIRGVLKYSDHEWCTGECAVYLEQLKNKIGMTIYD